MREGLKTGALRNERRLKMSCRTGLWAAEEHLRMRDARGAGTGKGPKRGERRRTGGPGEAGTREQVPPYQAAQIVLLGLHGERGGPGQYPASKVDAATQVQVLGLADGRRGGQGARIHYLGHGCEESRCTRPAPQLSASRLLR